MASKILSDQSINPLNAELNPICHLLALLGAHHILHVSRIRVKFMVFWDVTSYNLVYTTTQCQLSKDRAPAARKLHMPYWKNRFLLGQFIKPKQNSHICLLDRASLQ